MEMENQKNCKNNDDMRSFYLWPTMIFCIVFILAICATMVYAWMETQWHVGIMVFLAADILLAGLAITAMVATYREMSRMHERQAKREEKEKN